MKILFVTSYPLEYNTSANIRNLGLIQGFLQNGDDVYTFSTYPTDLAYYDGELLDFPFKGRFWIGGKSAIVENSSHKLVGKLKGIASSIITKFSVYDRRALLARSIGKTTIDESFDVVISSSDPKSAHVLAEKLIKVMPGPRPRWIQYWGDPFTGDISNHHTFSENRVKKEELRMLKMADKVVYVSPFTKEEMTKKYPMVANKLSFLPIPFLKKESQLDIPTEKDLVAYLGDYHSKNRNILPFVESVTQLKIKAIIVGSSDLMINSTETLTVQGRVYGNEIEELSAKAGVYVCICNLHGTQIPGKVYHYVDSGKPILVILDGEKEEELKEYFESFNRFYLCKNNKEDIVNTLQKVLSENRIFRTPVQLRSNHIAQKFLE